MSIVTQLPNVKCCSHRQPHYQLTSQETQKRAKLAQNFAQACPTLPDEYQLETTSHCCAFRIY